MLVGWASAWHEMIWVASDDVDILQEGTRQVNDAAGVEEVVAKTAVGHSATVPYFW